MVNGKFYSGLSVLLVSVTAFVHAMDLENIPVKSEIALHASQNVTCAADALTETTIAKKLLYSIALGTVIGVLHGFVYAQIEKRIFGRVTLLGWFIAMATRNAHVTAMLREAERDKVKISSEIVGLTAWIADWSMYFYFLG
jgi:hypothetical protein